MEDNYPKAYKEVIEVLNYVPEESVGKIPKEMIDTFKANMDKDYDFKVDIEKSFEQQELLDETKAILANIFRDYWATPEQREKIIAKEKLDRRIAEEEKRKKYNPDNLFINKEKGLEVNNMPIEVKKEKFYERIITFFKKLFSIS